MIRNNPVFSIITPTCRRHELLARAIGSVLAQTFDDFEHIIVDDASDDEILPLIKGFNDDRLVFYQHPVPAGAAAAYNSGIRIASGKYILFLDDDDEYMPGLLENVHNFFLGNGDIGFVWTGVQIVRDDDKGESLLFNKLWPSEFRDRESALVAATTIGNGYGLCLKKENIDKVGLYDESIRFGQDAEFLFRLVRYFEFRTIPKVLVKIHYHKNDQLTDEKNNLSRLELREKILYSNMDLLNRYPKLLVIHFNHLASLSYGLGLHERGRNYMLRMIKRFPFVIMNYANLAAFEISGKDFLTITSLRKLKRLIFRNQPLTA